MPKVVILCGGQGTRLREETEFKPKPLVEIGGLPILWHIMKHYSHHGHAEFVLCLGYKGRMIKEFFMDYEWDVFDFTMNLHDKQHAYHRTYTPEDWTITFANTGEKTLTGGRLKAIGKYIPEEDDFFLMTYGDGVADIDINALIAFHKKHGKLVTITGARTRGKYGLLEVNEDSEITLFAEKPDLNGYINGGYMVIDKKVLDLIEEDCSFEISILPQLAQDRQVALFPHDGFWHSMDTYKDFQDLNAMWDNGAPWKVWDHHPRRR